MKVDLGYAQKLGKSSGDQVFPFVKALLRYNYSGCFNVRNWFVVPILDIVVDVGEAFQLCSCI